MGAAISNNIANQMVNDSINIANTYTRNCSSQISSYQGISVTGCTAVIKNVNFSNSQFVDSSCISSASTQTNMQSNISQQLSQQASAIVQQFGLSAAVSNDISNVVTNLAQNITNVYTTKCVPQIQNNQGITCSDSNLTVDFVTFNGTQQSASACTTNDSTVNDAISKIASLVSQSAVAEQQNFFAGALGGVVFLIIIISIVLKKKAENNRMQGETSVWFYIVPVVIVLFGIAILVYCSMAQSKGWYPFLSNSS